MPPALFSGVIDKYIDLTGTYRTTIHGPIHINGWKSEGKWHAFLLSLSLYPGAITNFLDPPDLVSVSFPEDPSNPDWQPSISGLTLSHEITYVHLPVRIDIPSVNWNKWEQRINTLFSRAAGEYSDSTVYALKRCHFDTSNVLYTTGDCGDSGQQYAPITGQPDDATDNSFPLFNCPPNTGDGRIHNCNRNAHALWNSSTKHIFDLFDQWDDYPNTYVEGTEPAMIGGGTGPEDGSLMPKVKFIFSPSFDFSGLIGIVTCLAGGTPMQDCLLGALGFYENREEFQFMGRHEFRDFVFIDGFIGMGLRTPYHSCGEGDGGLSLYCIVIPSIDILGLFTIPSFSFGLPHWHLGNALITGEVLVNGRLYMADYIHIDGGTIYATEHVIKDETSGYDITVDLSSLFCTILSWGVGSISIPLLGDLCGLLMSVLNPFIQMFVPWWPILDLTNNDLIDFETYLDIDGSGPYMDDVASPGTLYTMGDFRLLQAGWDATSFVANWLIGQFAGFISVSPSLDPIRIYNGGAIVAGGTPTGGAGPLGMYQYGNIYMDKHRRADVMTKNPDTGDPSNGYLFARGAVRLYGDLINDYAWGGLIDQCSASTLLALDEDCAAQGIFYSGGVAAGTRENDAFGKYTLGMDKSGYDYYTKDTCMNEMETEFWTNISDSISCITTQLGDMFGTAPLSEYNIRGHIFAGQIGAISNTNIRLEQDGSVRSDAVTRQYFKNLGGVPIDWMEISPPGSLPTLEIN